MLPFLVLHCHTLMEIRNQDVQCGIKHALKGCHSFIFLHFFRPLIISFSSPKMGVWNCQGTGTSKQLWFQGVGVLCDFCSLPGHAAGEGLVWIVQSLLSHIVHRAFLRKKVLPLPAAFHTFSVAQEVAFWEFLKKKCTPGCAPVQSGKWECNSLAQVAIVFQFSWVFCVLSGLHMSSQALVAHNSSLAQTYFH